MKFVPNEKGVAWETVLKAKLWSNQQAALGKVSDYLDSNSFEQALVRMPTGTGKTAVISVVAQLAADFPRVLILAPWNHLADQLRREVGERFWLKAELVDTVALRQVAQFRPSSCLTKIASTQTTGVLVCTNQTLERIHATEPTLFKALQEWVTAVLVDEGHREPAPKWAKAVRVLGKKTILFTATPYRNDRKLFNIDADYCYVLTFLEAVASRIVRSVDFVGSDWARSGSEVFSSFVRELCAFHGKQVRQRRCQNRDLRVIVRCATHEEVRRVTEALIAAGQSALGVHERFAAKGLPHLRKSVPDPDGHEAVFWVHQYKLMEGLDDPRFRILALFSPFQNARNLVQQVGRVIRNPTHKMGEKAFVFVHDDDRQKEFWQRFIAYEESVGKKPVSTRREVSVVDIVREARSRSQSFYCLGDFRHHLSANDVSDPRDIVRFRRSVRVFRVDDNVEFDVLVSAIEDGIIARDGEFFGSAYKSEDIYLALYELFEDSPLVDDLYLENRLAYVFVRKFSDLLFFYDSGSALPDLIKMRCAPLSQEELQRLFPNHFSTIREISLLNGDLGNHAFRRKTLGADSLKLVPPSLSDYVHLCSTAVGLITTGEESSRRYVGFTRSRVTELSASSVPYNEFIKWLDAVTDEINDLKVDGDETLERFAVTTEYDGNSAVKHILFDIDTHAVQMEESSPENAASLPEISDEELWKVSDGDFNGSLDGHLFRAKIVYNAERNAFVIESEALAAFFIEEPESGRTRPLDAYLNETQNFRAVLENGTIYAQGRFFAPQVKLWGTGRKRIELLNIIRGVNALKTVESEKGPEDYVGAGWPTDSVFGVITDLSNRGIFKAISWRPDILICNDIGAPEIADFFAISENPRRLAMIHAKAASLDSSLSASAFHEVCSQAVRYLGFFNPHDADTKLSISQIKRQWKIGRRKSERIIRNRSGLEPAAIRDRIDAMIRDALCAREVWVVLGGGLSQRSLQDQTNGGNRPPPHVLQLLYLLQSTWATVASVGATFRVFCKP